MSSSRSRRASRLLFLLIAAATIAEASGQPPVRELELDNGMRFLLVERPHTSMVAAGWAVRGGSADEPAAAAGLAHLVEHLLFKGSRTIGAVDAAREEKILEQIDAVRQAISEAESASPVPGSRRLEKLRQRLAGLRRQAAELVRDGELSFLYSDAGALGLDASTLDDVTFYFVTVPAEKLELWFWLESDRLLHPVFRGLEREKEVIAEERRTRIDATPSGAVSRSIDALFWGPSPYARSPLGGPGTLAPITRGDVRRFFETRYRARNLTAALVGRFDPQTVERLARRYFGRLDAGSGSGTAETAPPDRFAARPLAAGFDGDCACPDQVRVLYPTVPFGHPDSYPLQLLAALLNGRSGRLYRSMVLEQRIAFAASAGQHPLARAGRFVFRAESRQGVAPGRLVEAFDAELASLLDRPIPAVELERARNGLAADSFRRLKDPGALMKQLLIYDALGDWREIRDWPRKIVAVDEAAIRAAGERYLRPEARVVARIRRRGSGDSATS